MASLRCLLYKILFTTTYLCLCLLHVKQLQIVEEENALE
jgi:hypothetical protein